MLACICVLSAWSREAKQMLVGYFFFRLPWVFVVVRGFFTVLRRVLLLQTVGSRAPAQELWFTGLVSCPWCGIFPDQGPNLRPLHWKADS